MLSAFLVIYFHGDRAAAAAIHESWRSLFWGFGQIYPEAPLGALGYLGNSVEGESREVTAHLFSPEIGVLGFMPLWSVVLWMIFNRIGLVFCAFRWNSTISFWVPRLMMAVMFFQLLAVTPLFFVAMDYWRWIFIWLVSSVMGYLIIADKLLVSGSRFFAGIQKYAGAGFGCYGRTGILFFAVLTAIETVVVGGRAYLEVFSCALQLAR